MSAAANSEQLDGDQQLRRIEAHGVELACIVSSNIDDRELPLAVCVHGFPDTAHTWRLLTPRLEAAGFRVAAPFTRGYAPSGIPADGSYRLAASALDMSAVHERFGGDGRASIIGHDWGAPISYLAASSDPERWASVVGMAVPPGPALGAAWLTNPEQMRRAWYIWFFQTSLADMVVPADDLAFLHRLWREWSPAYDPTRDLDDVRAALGDLPNLMAALGYYRAVLDNGNIDPALDDIEARAMDVPSQPLLCLHGADDGAIGAEVAEAARPTVGDNVTIEIVEDAGHFLHLERSDLVNDRILEFLA